MGLQQHKNYNVHAQEIMHVHFLDIFVQHSLVYLVYTLGYQTQYGPDIHIYEIGNIKPFNKKSGIIFHSRVSYQRGSINFFQCNDIWDPLWTVQILCHCNEHQKM